MEKSTRRFFAILSFWLVVIFITTNLMNSAMLEDSRSGPAKITAGDRHPELKNVLVQARIHYMHNDYIAALELLEEHESEFITLTESDRDFMYQYYQLRGYIHVALWQYIESEKMWEKASLYASKSKQKKRAREMIQLSTRAIEDVNHERNLKDAYHASPHVGPASALSGKIVLIYVFVTDSALHDWSLKQRTQVINTWVTAQNWLSDKAQQYGSDISFYHRLFVLDKHPVIKRLRVGDFNSDFENADKVAVLAAKHFGHRNILEFINHIKREESADQAVLMFHLARDGRSFASRCMQRCNEYGEFVFLMESSRPKMWQSLGYTQAHESLHLFGADDLYNIKKAKYYAVRDIMNYPSSHLNASTLEDMTAYATGLQHDRPATPFKIRKYVTGR